MNSSDEKVHRYRVKPSIWRIFNGLMIWLGMAAAVGGAIAIAGFIADTKISYNSFDFSRFIDFKLWLGLHLGILLVRAAYRFMGEFTGQDPSFFTARLKEDLYSNLVSFGWLFILSSVAIAAMGEWVGAFGNFTLGVVNLVAVYFLAAEHDEKELKRRAEEKSHGGHQAKAGDNK